MKKSYLEEKFNIPELKGISKKSIEEHLKLYSGYVKNTNSVLEKIAELSKDAESAEKNLYTLNELQRRFSFEFDGMKNHEYYFHSLEGGAKTLDEKSALKKKIEEEWGSFETWLERFKAISMTRGIGWAILYYDTDAKRLVNAWVDEQHLGHLTSASFIVGIDMWEHSFVFDYQPSGRKQYRDDFFANLNWQVIEENFKKAAKA